MQKIGVGNTEIEMSQSRKELMHRTMDGDSQLAGCMHVFSQYKFCDNFLLFMIAHNFTGKVFREMLIKQFGGNPHMMIQWIVKSARKYDARKDA
jgi:hypothetical protein